MANATRYNILNALSGGAKMSRNEIASRTPGGVTATDEELPVLVEEGVVEKRENLFRGVGSEDYVLADQEAADKFFASYNKERHAGESPTMGQPSVA